MRPVVSDEQSVEPRYEVITYDTVPERIVGEHAIHPDDIGMANVEVLFKFLAQYLL